MYLIINKWVIAVKVSNFSGQYLRNNRTLDIGVLGYIGIVWPKEHSPEVRSFPPACVCVCGFKTSGDAFRLPYSIAVGCSIRPFLVLFHPWLYTGCPRRNVPDFGRVFLMLNYSDITQNTYVQIWTVTEIMARGFWNFDSCYTLIDYQIHIKTGRNIWFL